MELQPQGLGLLDGMGQLAVGLREEQTQVGNCLELGISAWREPRKKPHEKRSPVFINVLKEGIKELQQMLWDSPNSH